MANPFEVKVPSIYEALLAGEGSYDAARKARGERDMAAARREAAGLAASNPQSAIARLLAANDLQGAQAVSSMTNATADRDWRRQEAARSQGNADRTHNLAVENAKGKPSIQKLKAPDGSEYLVRVMPDGTQVPIGSGAQASGDGGNPFGPGKFNEVQGKAAGFTDRMLQSEGILSGQWPMNGGQGPASPGVDMHGANIKEYGIENANIFGFGLPGVVKNAAHSEDYQKYDQAKRDFINAQLRRESGAAISPSEFDSANKQYFPMPGDTPDVIAQKRANRRASIEAQGREGGPSYRPKSTFGADGRLSPYRPQQGRAITKEQYDALPPGTPFTAPDGSQRVKP